MCNKCDYLLKRILELGKQKWPLVYDLPHHAAILKEIMASSGDIIFDWEKVNVSSHFVFGKAGHTAEKMIVR